jgi:ABC-type transport system involved in multi-copper enzyme maturation permease subunit
VGAGVFAAIGIIVAKPPPDGGADAATADPAGGSLTGVSIAVYAVATLGVLAVTSEYATGTIKPTLAAVPRRGLLVAGKVIAVAAATLVVTLPATAAAFFVAQAVLSTADITVSPAAPGVLRAVTGAALYLTVVAVLGSGLGWLLRSTAGAVATLVGILVVPQVVALFLPRGIAEVVVPYLPDNAGTAIMQLTPAGRLHPWAGFAVFLGYAAAVLTGAVLAIRRRDA